MLSRNTKRTLLGLTLALTVVVVFATATRHYFAGRAMALRLEEERAALVAPEPLTAGVERRNVERVRAYTVRLDPFRRAMVAAETSGRVSGVHFDLGDQVEKEALLVELDDTLARLARDAAETALGSARLQEKELTRRVREAEALVSSRNLPETQLESLRSQLEVQRSEIARLQVELRRQEELLVRHVIRAPFSGLVEDRLVETGESVNPNAPVISLVELDPLRGRFFVSDLDLPAFSTGQELTLRFEAGERPPATGTVHAIGRSADPVTGVFTIEIRVPNPEGLLPGGLRATVSVPIRLYQDTLFIPSAAVRFEGPRALTTVWDGENGTGTIRRILLGPELDGYYPVKEGLSEGEKVLLR